MRQGNATRVRRMIEAYIGGDVGRAREFLDPRVRAWAGERRGDVRAPRFVGETWITLDEVIDAGDEVMSVTREHGVGTSIGLDVEFETVIVWTLRRGWVVAKQVYETRRDAMNALGLSS